MKHFSLKKTFAVLFATACCVNVFARWGAPDPMFPYEVIKAWNYQQNSWMNDLPDNTPLNKVAMVSSHDAGINEDVYPYPTCAFSTQYHTIYEQLSFGARFFDLRVRMSKGAFWTHHGGAYGMSLANIFDDAVKFLNETESKNETIIFELSHWDYEQDITSALDVILKNPTWSEKLFKDEKNSPVPPILNEVTLGQVRGKIIILVEGTNSTSDEPENALDHSLARAGYTPAKGVWRFGALASNPPSKGKYGYFRLYDSYSDAKSYDYMRDDQARKFNDFCRNNDKKIDSFLYCWQLTAKGEPINLYAQRCNRHLDTELNTVVLKANGEYPNLVNLDYIDNRICNIVINFNVGLRNKAVSYLAPRFIESDKSIVEERNYCKTYTTLTGEYKDLVHLTNGWYYVDGNVQMNKGALVFGEEVHIILKDNSTLRITGDSAPGISASDSRYQLHIYAQSNDESTMGKMIVSGADYCAAIGGHRNSDGRNINIHGGNIEANGGWGAAAIGGGYAGSGVNIKIYGGIIKAKSFKDGAAIGGGCYSGGGATGDNITIYGGNITADASRESTTAAGIGGAWGGDGKNIKIYGGHVKAIGTSKGAGIGGGARWNGCGGSGVGIEIHGGIVEAKGGPAIGGGLDSDGRNIKIFGGKVTATVHEDAYSAAIGGGHGGSAEDIEISGGHVIIQGGKSGAGIGGGCKNGGGANAKNITISGGTVDIYNISGGHSIGSANNGSSSNIVICGGSVWARSAGSGVDNPKDAKGDSGRPVREVTVPECGSSDSPVHLYGLPSYGCNDLFPKSGELKLWLPDGSYDFSSETIKYSAKVSGSTTTAQAYSHSVEVVVGDSGYATVYSHKKLKVPDGVLVYAYNFKYGTEELHSTSIGSGQVLPANQGYVIKAKEGTYHFFETDGTPVSVDSILKGVIQDRHISEVGQDKVVYGLGRVNGKTAFYKYTSDYLKAGKAYLIKNK